MNDADKMQALGDVLGEDTAEMIKVQGLGSRVLTCVAAIEGGTTVQKTFTVKVPKSAAIDDALAGDAEPSLIGLLNDAYEDVIEKTLVPFDVAVISDLRVRASTVVSFDTMNLGLVQATGVADGSMLFTNDIWDDLRDTKAVLDAWTPPKSYERLFSGEIGMISNIHAFTDGFRYETLRVLPLGTAIFLGTPKTTGQHTEPSLRIVVDQNEAAWLLHVEFEISYKLNPKAEVRICERK